VERILRWLPYDDAVRARFADDASDLRRRARLAVAFCALACSCGWTLAGSHFFVFEIPARKVDVAALLRLVQATPRRRVA
jgi:hypothetical protein